MNIVPVFTSSNINKKDWKVSGLILGPIYEPLKNAVAFHPSLGQNGTHPIIGFQMNKW